MQNIVKEQYEKLGIDNTGADHLQSYVRSTIVGHACSYAIDNCTETAKTLLAQYIRDPDHNP